MEIWEQTEQIIAQKIQMREISAEEVTRSALNRLAEVNPSINAVVDNFDQEAIDATRVLIIKSMREKPLVS
jgi:amidase